MGCGGCGVSDAVGGAKWTEVECCAVGMSLSI